MQSCSPLCRSLRSSLRPRRPHRPKLIAAARKSRERTGDVDDEATTDSSIPSNRRRPRPPSPHPLWLPQLATTALSGATLGPLCDGLHSRYGVLRYANPVEISPLNLETTWWTPLLFAVAGIIIGTGLPLLDEISSSPASTASRRRRPPPPPSAPDLDRGWPLTLAAISAFVLIYFLSAVGGAQGRSPEWLLPSLWGCSLALFALVDGTAPGLLVAAATALGGPAVELLLIKSLHLYRYADESFAGAFPAWIAAVYFAGGPAVGALGRRVRAELVRKKDEEEEESRAAAATAGSEPAGERRAGK